MINVQTLFYKTVEQFAKEYSLNVAWVDNYLEMQGKNKRQKVVIGMTELNLLNSLGLIDLVGDIDEVEDPRNLIYILHIDI